jgi:integrase
MATRRSNNAGAISVRPNGNLQARVTVGTKDDGTPDRISKTFGANEKTLANQWIADQISAMGRGVNLSARNTSWKELQDQWLATKKATVSGGTYDKHYYAAKHIPWTTDPAKDCVQKVQQLLNGLKLSPATIRDVYSVIRGVLELAVEKDIVFKLPRYRLPATDEREPALMSMDELSKLLAASSKRKSKYSFGLWLELGTGLRRSEMLALDWADFDFDACTVTVKKALVREGSKIVCNNKTKTKAGRRTIDVPKIILEQLEPKKGTGPVFVTDTGERLAPANWSRLFRSWRKQAGIEHVRFHDLRHQFASFMHLLGVPGRTTQQMTGHADMTTLMQRYTHVTPDETRAASEKLGELLKPLLN